MLQTIFLYVDITKLLSNDDRTTSLQCFKYTVSPNPYQHLSFSKVLIFDNLMDLMLSPYSFVFLITNAAELLVTCMTICFLSTSTCYLFISFSFVLILFLFIYRS